MADADETKEAVHTPRMSEADRQTVERLCKPDLRKNVLNAAAAVVVLLGLVRFKLLFAVIFAA